jgi:hypothetical protein
LEDAVDAVLVVLVPPLAAAAACAAAVFRDRRGACHPSGRWPLHHTLPTAAGSAPAASRHSATG